MTVIDLDDRAVVNGVLVRSSVSQMQTFSAEMGGCARKWWYQYVARLPRGEDTEAIIYGKEAHAELADFWNTDRSGHVPDRVAPVVALLGRQMQGEYESPLRHLSLAGIPFKGAIDLTKGPYVYDYKFQGKYRRLDFEAQAYGYLEEVRRRRPDLTLLSFSYIHVLSKPPYTARFSDSLTLEARAVEAKWQEYVPLMEEMKATASLKENEVWCNTGACYAYGRPCPYAAVCNKGASTERVTKETNNMSFLNELLAAKNEVHAVSVVGGANVDPTPYRAEVRALPPDAPASDIVPDPTPTPPSARKKAKPSATRIKSIRLGLKVGMPEYSSVEASVEVEGSDEEAMADEAKKALMRRLEALVPAYMEALELKKAKGGK